MTSSDLTALPPDAIASAATRVGACHSGEPGAGSARVGIVGSKFNGGITSRLLDGALSAFASHGIGPGSISLAWVPGAFEVPLTALRLASSGDVDVVVVLGAVIRGDTPHFDYVAGECAAGCQRVALDTGVPVVFGVLTTNDVSQALDRCGPDQENRGYQAAITALEMCDVLGKIGSSRVPVP